MNQKLKEAWAEAEANPGKQVDIGRIVVCEGCDEDFTDSNAKGGMIFGSRAICPTCHPKWLRSITAEGEERFIKARCPEGQSFADFVRAYRGPNTKISITKGAL